ncbi:MAG: sugar kinase [Nitrososphaeraceae archaeon]|nr:sugar kinase [Nitrososphaeraceae archaeon]
MKIALSLDEPPDSMSLAQIRKTLDYLNISISYMKDGDYSLATDADIILVLGGDRGILNYFHKVVTNSVPVLGLYESEAIGFLAQLDIRYLDSALSQIRLGDYHVDDVFRLAVKVDGKEVEPVLNDVAVFPSKSAMLMEHVLKIDGRDVWHDSSDGIIVATPTGSTAYSMSAGGPMVLEKSRVFIVVSVNSVDNTRRPLIVPYDTNLQIADITSRYHCEVVLDGGSRIGIKKTLECYRHQFPAKLLRLSRDFSATSMIAKKVKLAEDLLSMPPSAKLVLKTLEYEGALSQKDLSARTMLPERTVRLSLSHLLTRGFVNRKTSLRDARQKIYELRI